MAPNAIRERASDNPSAGGAAVKVKVAAAVSTSSEAVEAPVTVTEAVPSAPKSSGKRRTANWPVWAPTSTRAVRPFGAIETSTTSKAPGSITAPKRV